MNPKRSTWMLGFVGLLALLYCSVAQANSADYRYEPVVTDPAYDPGWGPVIAVDTQHDNFHTIDDLYNDKELYRGFKLLLEADGAVVQNFEKSYVTDCVEGIPDCPYFQALLDIDVLVIANARESVGEDEAAAIATWVSGDLDDCVNCSRSLMLIADHPDFPLYISELSEQLGLDWLNSNVLERTFVPDPESETGGILDTSHVVTQGRNEYEDVTEVKTFRGSCLAEAEPLTGGVSVLIISDPGRSCDGWSQGMVFRYGRGSVYASGEAAMFTAQKAGNTPGSERAGMQVTTPCELQTCNEQYLLNIMHWLDGELDTDGDGAIDKDDNCRDVLNGALDPGGYQCDTNADGFGNTCDADLNNDGVVDESDYDEIDRCMWESCSDEPACCAADLNCDGVVDGSDESIFGEPSGSEAPLLGPSGLDCAGTIPCIGSFGDNDGVEDSEDYCPDTWDPTNVDGEANDLENGIGDACETGMGCAAIAYWYGKGENACPFGSTSYIVGSGRNRNRFTYCNLGAAEYFNYRLSGEPWDCAQLGDCPPGYDPYGPGGPGVGPLAQRTGRRIDASWHWYMYACQEE